MAVHRVAMAATLSSALAAACLVAVPQLAHSADSPARLREDEASIESKLRVPSGLEPGRYDVHCEVRVMSNGAPFDVICYALDPAVPRKLVDAVRRAGQRAKFFPAMRNGKPAQVYMVLMVRTVIARGEPLVLVVPNNGVERDRYGLLYIAPQRFNEFVWNSRSVNGTPERTLIWQELWIDEHGTVTDSKVTNATGAPNTDVKAVRRSVENMQFMPGFFEGKPVPMRYREPAYSLP
jgi:hypothetical protein